MRASFIAFAVAVLAVAPSAAQTPQLPSTTDFMNVLTLCGAGSRFNLNADLRRDAVSVYEQGRTQGRALQEILAAIMEKLPENERAGAYQHFLRCVSDVINPRLSQLSLGGAAPIEGRSFELDLGVVPAGGSRSVDLAFVPVNPLLAAQWTSASSGVQVAWADGRTTVPTTIGYNAFKVTVPAAAADGQLGGELLLSGDGREILRLRVSLTSAPAEAVQSASSGPRASGRGQDFSEPYRVCVSAPSVGRYQVVSSERWLSGARQCGGWSTCQVDVDRDGSRACLVFTLQGHSECLRLFANCDAVRNSEGHITARFRLIPSEPTLRVAGR